MALAPKVDHFRNGSIASLWLCAGHFRSAPNSGHGAALRQL